jgi:hypothetical protein
MMEFVADYGMFLLKVVTIVAGIVIIISAGAAAGRKATQDGLGNTGKRPPRCVPPS